MRFLSKKKGRGRKKKREGNERIKYERRQKGRSGVTDHFVHMTKVHTEMGGFQEG